MGSLLPPEGQRPRYMQLYVFYPTSEVNDRLLNLSSGSRNLDAQLMADLQATLDENNVLAQSFRKVCDALQEPSNQNLQLRIRGTRVERDMMYEWSTRVELAGLVPGNFEPNQDDRDIIVNANMRINSAINNTSTEFVGLTFPKWVLAVEDGYQPKSKPTGHANADWIQIPSCFIMPRSPNPIGTLVNRVYPNIETQYQSVTYIRSRAIITPKNFVLTTINDYVLTQLPVEEKIYLSSDTLTTPGPNQAALELQYPTEFLTRLSFNGMPEHQLRFKPYAIVMLLHNLNLSAGLCNGTRILLTHLANNVLRGLRHI
ncbi:hypothetical protein LINPERPRIM_LOCUS25386 [Linum perenne]